MRPTLLEFIVQLRWPLNKQVFSPKGEQMTSIVNNWRTNLCLQASGKASQRIQWNPEGEGGDGPQPFPRISGEKQQNTKGSEVNIYKTIGRPLWLKNKWGSGTLLVYSTAKHIHTIINKDGGYLGREPTDYGVKSAEYKIHPLLSLILTSSLQSPFFAPTWKISSVILSLVLLLFCFYAGHSSWRSLVFLKQAW